MISNFVWYFFSSLFIFISWMWNHRHLKIWGVHQFELTNGIHIFGALNLLTSASDSESVRWTDWLAAKVDFIDYHLSLIQGMFVTDRLAFSSILSSLRFKFKADRVAGWSLTNGKHAHRQAFSISLQVLNFTVLNIAQSTGLWRSSTSTSLVLRLPLLVGSYSASSSMGNLLVLLQATTTFAMILA
jgi:hypothetical protein